MDILQPLPILILLMLLAEVEVAKPDAVVVGLIDIAIDDVALDMSMLPVTLSSLATLKIDWLTCSHSRRLWILNGSSSSICRKSQRCGAENKSWETRVHFM